MDRPVDGLSAFMLYPDVPKVWQRHILLDGKGYEYPDGDQQEQDI